MTGRLQELPPVPAFWVPIRKRIARVGLLEDVAPTALREAIYTTTSAILDPTVAEASRV